MITAMLLLLEGMASASVVPSLQRQAGVLVNPTHPDGAMSLRQRELQERVQQRLRQHGSLDAEQVRVLVFGENVVQLRGQVETLLSMERVVHLVQSTPGVDRVQNRLQVEPVAASNAQLQAAVLRELEVKGVAGVGSSNVSVYRRVVTLHGMVDLLEHRRMAEQVTKGVPGVRAVKNELMVTGLARSDDEIRAGMERALSNRERVQVHVFAGTVVLRGLVDSTQEREQLKRVAFAQGATSVDVHALETTGLDRVVATEETDRFIRLAVQDALLTDSRVDGFDVAVEVRNGVVQLLGTVATHAVRQAAAHDAARIPGVWRVENRLRVRTTEPVDDEMLEQHVIAELQRVLPGERELGVTVDRGVVRLTGNVESQSVRQRAQEAAYSVPGIRDVSNLLRVPDSGPR